MMSSKISRTLERMPNGQEAWRYHDQDESEFVFVTTLEGVPLESVDSFIDGAEGAIPDDVKKTLLGQRMEALNAWKAKKSDLSISRAETLFWMARFFGFHIAASPKVIAKKKQEEALRSVQPEGTKANKERADRNRANLDKAMSDYISNYPNALALGNDGLIEFLTNRNLRFGYKDSSIIEYAKPLFAKKRKEIRTT